MENQNLTWMISGYPYFILLDWFKWIAGDPYISICVMGKTIHVMSLVQLLSDRKSRYRVGVKTCNAGDHGVRRFYASSILGLPKFSRSSPTWIIVPRFSKQEWIRCEKMQKVMLTIAGLAKKSSSSSPCRPYLEPPFLTLYRQNLREVICNQSDCI